MEIRALSNTFAAEIVGRDLTMPLHDEELGRIDEAFVRHHVLVFRDQVLDKRAQLDVTLQFGELDVHAGLNVGADIPEVHTVSNLDANGVPRKASLASQMWHSDKSYRAIPSTATFLHAIDMPPGGGDTCFADTQSAFAALPAERQAHLRQLRVVHDWGRSVARNNGGVISEKERTDWPPIAHPLIPCHPGSGREGIFIGQHASHIEGIPFAAGEALIAELLAHVTSPPFVYQHRWREGDLLMWDNRCLLHRALDNFEGDQYRRILHRTVTRGTAIPM
jgi:alpha-ketoglutarate-dependent taurine dioxygenase